MDCILVNFYNNLLKIKLFHMQTVIGAHTYMSQNTYILTKYTYVNDHTS